MGKQTLRSRVDISSSLRFSGSQTVTKGQPVVWILDEFDAFKLTEKCKISMDATPFVTFKGGNEFIIKKGATYIFDRDTEVALAYPQEKTQDILIENKNYNDINNNITIEADKAPVAHAGSNQRITIGQTVKLIASDYPIPPATITAREWKLNGVVKATTNVFTYLPSVVRRDDLIYTVTDSTGRKASDSLYVDIQAKPVIPDIVQSEVGKGGGNDIYSHTNPWIMNRMTVQKGGTGAIIAEASIPITLKYGGRVKFSVDLLINGTQVDTEYYTNGSPHTSYTLKLKGGYNGTIHSGGTVEIRVRVIKGAIEKIGAYAGTLQTKLKVTNRTA